MSITVTSINGMGSATISGSTVVTTGMNAEDHMHFSCDFLTAQGFVGSADCAATQNGTPNQTVNVAAGSGYVLNSSWAANSTAQTRFWRFVNDASVNVSFAANASGNPRIDSVFAQINTSTTPDASASNVCTFVVVQGTPAGSPTAPATPNNSLRIADITLANGYTQILTANIADQRVRVSQSITNATLTTPTITSATEISPAFQGLVSPWVLATDTWAYVSANSIKITGLDRTGYYTPGMFIRYKQGGAYQYRVIASAAFSSDTTITLMPTSDYTLTNTTITDTWYSMDSNAVGIPAYFNYSATLVGWAATPSQTCKYNVNGRLINVCMYITGTSNATTATATLPVAVSVGTNDYATRTQDNGAAFVLTLCQTASTLATFYPQVGGGNWTASGTKTISNFMGVYGF